MKTVCSHNCASCFAVLVCAVNAMIDQREAILVDTEKCIGCGACRTACLAFSADQGLAKQSQVRRRVFVVRDTGMAAAPAAA